jgi:hypothetical protein
VAVVQISKIQIRRGLKNSGIGVPQLSSAEFAWAVDTQELYIGNGAISEGAPYVGNTKILTENDNILELAGSYRFAADDTAIANSIPRSLQSKIDEIAVSVADFGAVGDGSTSANSSFDDAMADLFRNSNDNYKKVLIIPNGTYYFTADLRIPSSTILRGETRNGSILDIGAFNIVFLSESGEEVQPGVLSTDRPSNISFSNMTIRRSSGQMVLTGVRDSVLDGVTFQGEYVLDDYSAIDDSSAVGNLSSRSSAIFWQNTLDGNKTTGIKIVNCSFNNLPLAIKVIQSITSETVIDINDCYFSVNDVSIFVDGAFAQQCRWKVQNTKFEIIANQAFYANAGRGFYFSSCEFVNCGNGGNDAATPITEIIYFGESTDNKVLDCVSDRHQRSALTSSESTIGISETVNSNLTSFKNFQYTPISISDSFAPLCVFSAENRFIFLTYILSLGAFTRVGKITVVLNEEKTEVAISDEYHYSSTLSSSTGGTYMTDFEFDATLRNNDIEDGVDTILLSYKNPIGSISGSISYQVAYGV